MKSWFQDVFNIAHSIFVQVQSSFFSIRLVSVHMVHRYSRIDTTAVWKKLRFILSHKSDFHIINNLSITVHAFGRCRLMSFSVDKTLLPKLVKFSTDFGDVSPPFLLKHVNSVLSAFTWRPMPPAACSRQCSRESARVGVFARSAMSSSLSASVIVCVSYRLIRLFFLL